MTKADLTLRLEKGSELSFQEVDDNFERLLYYSADYVAQVISPSFNLFTGWTNPSPSVLQFDAPPGASGARASINGLTVGQDYSIAFTMRQELNAGVLVFNPGDDAQVVSLDEPGSFRFTFTASDTSGPICFEVTDATDVPQILIEGIVIQTGQEAEAQEVYRFEGELWACIQDTTSAPAEGSFWHRLSAEDAMRWKNLWASGDTYKKGEVVRDGNWTMIANTETSERPAPIPTGESLFGYSGANPTTIDTAKQIIFGQRYEALQDVFVNALRVYTRAGNFYEVFTVSNGIVTPQRAFEATEDGWVNILISPALMPAGSEFDLVAVTYEPDVVSPVDLATYNYQTPNNPILPAAGQAIQSNKDFGLISFHKTDDLGGDQSSMLSALTVGDIIKGNGIDWAIQSATEQTNHFDFEVSPELQMVPDGVFEFGFQSTQATPITYLNDPAYYAARPNIKGLLAIDADYGSITPDSSAYGCDLEIQEASISEDWDVVAVSDGATVASSPGLPSGGSQGQFLTKASSASYDADWATVDFQSVPPDGTTGQVLKKISDLSFDMAWEDESGGGSGPVYGYGGIKQTAGKFYPDIGGTWAPIDQWDTSPWFSTALNCVVSPADGTMRFDLEGFWQVKLNIPLNIDTFSADRELRVRLYDITNTDPKSYHTTYVSIQDGSCNVIFEDMILIDANDVGNTFRLEWQCISNPISGISSPNSWLRVEHKYG